MTELERMAWRVAYDLTRDPGVMHRFLEDEYSEVESFSEEECVTVVRIALRLIRQWEEV